MSRSAFVIDRIHNPHGYSYLVLDPGSKQGQRCLALGMIVPCEMGRTEAVELCGEERVLAYSLARPICSHSRSAFAALGLDRATARAFRHPSWTNSFNSSRE